MESDSAKKSLKGGLKRESTEKWNEYETRKFYFALQVCGIDFSTIEILFNNKRTRN